MGLGLAHIAFDRSNAMLALSGDFKFSAKNITHSDGGMPQVLLLKEWLSTRAREVSADPGYHKVLTQGTFCPQRL